MRLFQLILENVSPQRIARDLIEVVSNSNEESVFESIQHFLHSIMDAIGFNYYATINEISNIQFRWPEQEAMYFIFHYDRSVFDRYGIFLESICKIMNRENLLEILLKFIEMFLNFLNSMDPLWEDNFKEPFSLISFSLLKSMHKIRKTFPEPSLVLDNICHKLFENSQKGLGFPDSHETIFKGLCILLEKDYDRFLYFDENVFKFYANCLEYEISGLRRKLFHHMKNAIDNSNIANGSRRSLVEFLTDSKMIKVYCVFAEHWSSNLVSALLKFLNSLLSHLPVLECFTREQLHIIFSNALSRSESIRSLAIKFYMIYMRRSFTDKLILRDILDFYLIKANNIEILDEFIESLWDEFPYMTKFEPYLRILSKSDWNLKTLSVTAQFITKVYEKLYKECENNDEYALRLSRLLLKLPSLLNLLNNKWQIRGILLHIYSLTDCEAALITIKDFPIAADRFVNYALNYLLKQHENYSVVQNTSYTMLKLMDFLNMEEEMERFASSVLQKYKALMTDPMALTKDQVKEVQHYLILFSSIMDTSLALNEESLFELMSSLRTWLMDSNALEQQSVKHNCFLDSYAIKTYSGCLNVLTIICAQITPDEANIESTVLLSQLQPFLTYLLKRLKNENQSKVTIFFAEAAMRALCDLYIVFNFKLERHVYHVMVNFVNTQVFEASVSSNRLRQLELQRNILHCFNLLHKFVEIPAAITWKIVIHYGLAPNFEKELTELLDILFEYNSAKFQKPSLFTYVVPVAIYNLFQRRIHFQQFHKALKAYKKYVEDKVPDRTQRIMKVHIVLTMTDMIERAIQAGEIHQQSNRMELLSNMNILLTDVYQNESNLILSQSRRLERHSLTQEELDTLASFQDRLTQ